jgi:integrase
MLALTNAPRYDGLELSMYSINDGRPPKARVRVARGVYRQRNGKYAVCFMLDGRPTFRTVGYELEFARQERQAFVEAARWGVVAGTPRLRFGHVAGWWMERFERRVATGERGERTLDFRRYHLEHHLLPAFASRPLREISVQDVRELLDSLREQGRAENTIAGALATFQCVMRFAVRNGWIADSPVNKLEADERPHPSRLAYRVLGREEIQALLDACLPAYRTLIATALYTGMRHSELLGLIWRDVDLRGGVVHVRTQLSRARSGTPCRRVALKTRSARRQIPLTPQLATLLGQHRATSPFNSNRDWVFATRNGTPLAHRNVQRSALSRAVHAAGLEQDGTRLRFHDLRHTFASHLIVDLNLDVVQVSRMLGHASPATTLDIYAHLFDDARHAADIRTRMSRSEFARLLEDDDEGDLITLPAAARPEGRPSGCERAAIRWTT